MTPIDLTPVCWIIRRQAPHQVRLEIYTAPGAAPLVSRRLQQQGYRSRTYGGRTLAVANAVEIHELALRLGASPGLAEALAEYELAHAGGRRGLSAQGRRPRQIQAVDRVMAMAPTAR